MPGPSHSDSVLAELDVVAALEMTTGDAIMDAKIRALSNLHSQKVRALMKSVNSLKGQIAVMKAQSKEHRRSSLITGLRDKVRESELVVDILKTELTGKTHMSTTEVNDFIVKRSLGGKKKKSQKKKLLRDQITVLTVFRPHNPNRAQTLPPEEPRGAAERTHRSREEVQEGGGEEQNALGEQNGWERELQRGK